GCGLPDARRAAHARHCLVRAAAGVNRRGRDPRAPRGRRAPPLARRMTADSTAVPFATTGWPWRPGNDFRLLDGGAVFFERMLAAIDAARSHVLLEMYLVSSGRVAGEFIEALTRARARGVRCCLVFDGFGALGLSGSDRWWLEEAGVELRF